MHKIAYFACSYQNRDKYRPLFETLKYRLKAHGWGLTSPVFDLVSIDPSDVKLVMDQSFQILKTASVLVAEASEKNIGIGIEIGYAKSLNIPIAYLKRTSASLSTTVAGTATKLIEYDSDSQAVDILTNWLAESP